MTPTERIAAAQHEAYCVPEEHEVGDAGYCVFPNDGTLRIAASLAADLELAAAVRRLRQAGPGRLEISDSNRPNEKSWHASVWSAGKQLAGRGDTPIEAIEEALR